MDQEAAVGDATRGWLLPEKSLMAMVDPSGKPVAILSTFDTFVAGPSNQLAFAASQAAAPSDPPRYNPVFLSRSNGLGGGAPRWCVDCAARAVRSAVGARIRGRGTHHTAVIGGCAEGEPSAPPRCGPRPDDGIAARLA